MKKPTKSDKFSPGHHMGKYYGYDVYPDGKIKLAPALCEQIERALERDLGLRAFIEATNKFLTDEFTAIAREKRKFWSDVREDLGLGTNSQWTYQSDDGTISPKEEPDTPEEDKDG